MMKKLYIIGIVNSEIIPEDKIPPADAMPTSERSSAPIPVPKAIGSMPRTAAVVIMITGRNRLPAALMIASSRGIFST